MARIQLASGGRRRLRQPSCAALRRLTRRRRSAGRPWPGLTAHGATGAAAVDFARTGLSATSHALARQALTFRDAHAGRLTTDSTDTPWPPSDNAQYSGNVTQPATNNCTSAG